MTNKLSEYSDRELLEAIYTMLQYVIVRVNEIDNDDKQFGMNLAADLLGSIVYDAQPRTTRYAN
ncbi:hypothetical protein [uncultured phage cr56_1]|jgi:hypothetical protein|uniref:Uncharacterized protein n=1 Tax=uncultured phage cr56_1 TaxID=2772081 RepID=A0A7M1RRG6_9CAUD|nr:hypothetical protein KNV48_gp60 [uncultured phage cr56_1]QOR56866.1 hypothetical protein [uncultured phage cr56_1]DAH06693.1 MAG TPA: hypothetical protein [Caudoviricetes sp.]